MVRRLMLTLWMAPIVALSAAIVDAGDDAPAPMPALLAEFDGRNPATPEVRKVLDATPRRGADSTYAGLLNHAERAAKELKNATGLARKALVDARTSAAAEVPQPDAKPSRTPPPLATRTPEAGLELDMALERYLDGAGELEAALDAAEVDPIRWLLAAKAAHALVAARPTREALAPLKGETGRRIDAAQRKIDGVMARLIGSGYRLREDQLKKLPPDGSSVKDRASTRAVTAIGLAARARAIQAFDDRLAKEPLMLAFHQWMREEDEDTHEGRPGSIDPLDDDPGAPKFAAGDVPGLVPWPYALAEALGLGTIRLSWEVAGFEAADAAPATTTINPRINVAARFALKAGAGRPAATLPIYVIKLRGPEVDARTFGDEVGYRKDLAFYADGKFPAPAKDLIADNVAAPTAVALWAKLADPVAAGGPVDLTPFHNFRRRTLGDQLAHNATAHALYQRTWGPAAQTPVRAGGSTLDRELYWIARSSRLKLAAPIVPAPAPAAAAAPAPATPAPPPPPADETWFTYRGLGSRPVEPFELDMAAVAGPLRDAFARMLDRVEAGTIADVDDPADSALARLAESEGASRGTTARAIAAELRERKAQVADHLLAAAPSWLTPDALFDHPGPGEARTLPDRVPSRLVEDLATVWRIVEIGADQAVEHAKSPPVAWHEFAETLAGLEAVGFQSYGPEFGRDPKAVAASPEANPLLIGRVRPSARADRRAPGSDEGAAWDKLKADAVEVADRAAMIRVAMLEVAWIDRVLALSAVGSALWPPYVQAHAVAAPAPTPAADPKAAAVPAVPPALDAAPDAALTNGLVDRRVRLVAVMQGRLAVLVDLAESLKERAASLQAAALLKRRAEHPESAYAAEAGEVPGSSVVKSLDALADRLKAALGDAQAIAAPSTPLPATRFSAYTAVWPVARPDVAERQVRAALRRFQRLDSVAAWSKDAAARVNADLPHVREAEVVTKHHDPALMLARAADGAFAEVLDRAWTLEAAGLPPRLARRAALAEYVADGAAVDPADRIVQELHQVAAKAGWTLDVRAGGAGIEGRDFWPRPKPE